MSLRAKGVRLGVIPNLTMDLRDPKVIAAQKLREGIEAHKERRAKEQTKVEPALGPTEPLSSYPSWRLEDLARKYADDEPREREREFYHPYG